MAETLRTSGLDVLIERIAETRAQNPRGAVDLSKALVERARRNKDRYHEAAGLYQLGVSEMALSELSQAEDHLGEALRRFKSQNDDDSQLLCRYALANLALKRGDTRVALNSYQALLALVEGGASVLNGDFAKLLNNHGVCHERLGEYAKALQFYYRSLGVKQAENNRRGEAFTLHNIATIFARVDEFRRAAAYNRLSLRILKGLGDVAGVAALYIGLAESYRAFDNNKRALKFYKQALEAAKQASDKGMLARACLGIAHLALAQGELKHAVGNLNVALNHARRGEDTETEAEVQLAFGEVDIKAGNLEKAESRIGRALDMAKEHEFVSIAQRAHKLMAAVNEQQGQFEQAYQHLAEHQSLSEQLNALILERRMKAVSVPMELARSRAKADALKVKSVDLANANAELRQLQSENQKLLNDLEDKAKRLERESREDPLTGLANRRRLDEALIAEWERSERFDRSLSLAAFDIDHFKQVNDRYGHATGDEVLVRLGEELAHLLRGSDLLARIGGEEFVLLLPETTLSEATALCERIREHFEGIDWSGIARDLKVTLSCGIASKRGCSDWEGLLKVADEHLYKAKADGRNTISTGF